VIKPKAPFLRVLLVITALLLAVGFVTPIMTITTFVVVDNNFSIVSGIWQLLKDNHLLLFIIIGLFSVILPIAKITLLFNLLMTNNQDIIRRKRLLHLMHEYGRWAMLDVMVVAILLVTVKLGAIASIEIHTGLYIFGAAILLTMFITHHVVRLYDETT
jgi:paraquat-inducible protein A